jgi:hypothetical protein
MNKLLILLSLVTLLAIDPLTGPGTDTVQFNRTNKNVLPNGLNAVVNTLGATNGTIVDTLNVGQSVRVGETNSPDSGVLTLGTTNFVLVVQMTIDGDGNFVISDGTNTMMKLLKVSGYGDAGTKALFDDGEFKNVTTGAGITNININPTTPYLPYRSNATVFGDSPLFLDPSISTNLAIDSQMFYYGLGAGTANYERMMIDHQGASGIVFDSQAGGSGTARDFVFKAGGTTRATLSTTGSLTIPRSTTNDWIWLQTGFFANGHGDLQLDVPGGEAGEVLIQPVETTLPFVFDTRHPIGGAHTAFQNNNTNIVAWNGSGDGVFKGTLSAMTTVNVLSRAYGAACSDLTTPIIVGASQGIIRLPHKMTVTEVRASVKTAQTSGAILTFDVLENGVSILSNPITIDNGETTSTTPDSFAVISDSSLADDSVITLDTTQVGDGTAIGLQFWIIGTIAP